MRVVRKPALRTMRHRIDLLYLGALLVRTPQGGSHKGKLEKVAGRG
jgi:hypothetical protein